MTSAVAGLVNNTEFTDVTVDSPLEQRSYLYVLYVITGSQFTVHRSVLGLTEPLMVRAKLHGRYGILRKRERERESANVYEKSCGCAARSVNTTSQSRSVAYRYLECLKGRELRLWGTEVPLAVWSRLQGQRSVGMLKLC